MTTLLLFVVVSLQAQQSYYADLAGEWHISPGDQPNYASPTLDTSSWKTVQLPWHGERPIGVYWLRKTVDVPPIGRDQLAVTIGSVNEAYELYVNGVRVASTPGFGTDDPPYFRPRSFRIDTALADASQAVIAIRVWRPTRVVWIRPGYSVDHGPYRLAPMSVASDLVDRTVLQSLVRYAPYVLMIPVNLFLGIYLLSTFRTVREWPELFWLGCFSCFTSLLTGYNFAMAGGIVSSYWTLSMVYNCNVAISMISLAEFSREAYGLRGGIPRWLIWLALPLSLIQYWSPAPQLSPSILPAAICLFWSGRALVRSPGLRLTAAFVGLYSLLRLNQVLGSMAGITFLPVEIALGSVRLPTLSFTGSLIGLTLMALTMKRLLADKSEKQRLAGELEAAREVQRLLIPSAHLATPHYAIEAEYRPSQEVGGDFYHFLECADGSLLVVVGDVSGKGLKAAMLVTLITGALRHEERRQPGAVLLGLNRALAQGMHGGFATCCCVRLESDGTVVFANAGHLAPYMNEAEVQVSGGVPLGIDAAAEFPETRFSLANQLTLLSDGVVEAANLKGELFGFERTRQCSTHSSSEIAAAAQAWGQNDDITVVTIRRTRDVAPV